MQFYRPGFFNFLWLLPLILLIGMWSSGIWKSRIARFGNPDTVKKKLLPFYNFSQAGVRLVWFLLAVLCLILALGRPQWGESETKIERKGVDVVFMLDTSLSMLAEDAKPNRLEKSKREIKTIVRALKGDRIGMVAFAGTGFLQTPLTLDYAAFFLFLDSIHTGHIPDPGTSLDRALRLAMRAFPSDQTKYKAVILFTDGEDHEGGIEPVIAELKRQNVRVYCIGTGSLQGEPIPLKDEKGRRTGFKKDRQDNIVITQLNKPLLEKIAAETGGLYLPSTPGEQEAELLIRHMASLGQKSFKERAITKKEDHYEFFLSLALIFLLLELLVKKKHKSGTNGGSAVAPAVILCFFLFSGFLKSSAGLNNDGNEHFEKKEYQSALGAYRQAQVKKPDDPTIRYNLGTTLYQTEAYHDTLNELEQAVNNAGEDKDLLAKAYYNLGNTHYRLGNFDQAIDAYKEALKNNPDDEDAKFNLEFIQKKKSQFQGKNQNRQQQQNQQQNQKNQQNQQDQQQNQQDQQQNQQDQQQNQQDQQQNQQDQQQNQQDQQQNQQDQQQNQQDQQQNQQDQQQNQQDQQQNQQDQQQNQQDQQQNQQDQQQNQQDQQQNQQDQQQNQQDQQQNQQDQQQNQQDQQQNQQDQQQNQQDQQQNQQQNQQDQQQNQQQNQQDQQEQNEQTQDQEQGQGEQQDQTDQNDQQHSGQQQMPQQMGRGGGQHLQGQMSKQNALRILDALKEAEKEFEDLRRPSANRNPKYVEKDW